MLTVAIDYGTTRTKVAAYSTTRGKPEVVKLGREIREIVPSVIYVPKAGDFMVGDDAQMWVTKDPAGVVRGLKKEIHLGTPVRRNGRKCNRIDLAASLFSHIRQACQARVFHNQELTECSLTVPVRFDGRQRQCIEEAAKQAGFTTVTQVEEPVAAAKHWLREHPVDGAGIVVCDIGGGTTDIALLRRVGDELRAHPEVLPSGLSQGGNDVDDWIWEQLIEKHPDVIRDDEVPGLKAEVRRVKEWLLRSGQTEAKLEGGNTALVITAAVVRQAHDWFVGLLVEELQRFMAAMKSAKMQQIPLLLVGGGRCIPGLVETIRHKTKWDADVHLWEDSEYATVLGAVQNGSSSRESPIGSSSDNKSAIAAALTAKPDFADPFENFN